MVPQQSKSTVGHFHLAGKLGLLWLPAGGWRLQESKEMLTQHFTLQVILVDRPLFRCLLVKLSTYAKTKYFDNLRPVEATQGFKRRLPTRQRV